MPMHGWLLWQRIERRVDVHERWMSWISVHCALRISIGGKWCASSLRGWIQRHFVDSPTSFQFDSFTFLLECPSFGKRRSKWNTLASPKPLFFSHSGVPPVSTCLVQPRFELTEAQSFAALYYCLSRPGLRVLMTGGIASVRLSLTLSMQHCWNLAVLPWSWLSLPLGRKPLLSLLQLACLHYSKLARLELGTNSLCAETLSYATVVVAGFNCRISFMLFLLNSFRQNEPELSWWVLTLRPVAFRRDTKFHSCHATNSASLCAWRAVLRKRTIACWKCAGVIACDDLLINST